MDKPSVYEAARLELARAVIRHDQDLSDVFRRATEIAGELMQVDRVGIWIFRRGDSELSCVQQYVRPLRRHIAGERLDAGRYPRYLAALSDHRAIVAGDAVGDEATSELTDYLEAHGIGAMLDAPIFRSGDVVGVVCHEHVGGARVWTEQEQAFAGSVADLVALAFETAARERAQTRLRVLETRLLEAQKMEALGRLAERLGNELGNALMIVSASSQRIRRIAEGVDKDTDAIQSAVERISDVVRNLVSFGRRGAGKPERLDVDEMVTALEPSLESALDGRARLRLSLSGGEAIVVADRAELERALLQLVLHARDSLLGPGIVEISVTRRPPAAGEDLPPGDYVVLDVTDDGPGMAADVAARAFEPYMTGGSSGFALATVYGIVSDNGGIVRVESTPGEGTHFRVWLPEQGHAPPQKAH